jgi:hypothetical protein
MSWSNIIDIGMGIGSLASANRANNEAERLNALTEAQVTADINRNQEAADLYAGGADVMSNNLNRLLTEYGDFGQITPSIINDFSTFVSTNRAQEEAANRREVDGLTSYDRARLRGMEDMYREFSDVKLEEGRDEVYYQDEKAKLVAPQTLQFAQMQDQIAMQFQNLRNQNTNRALDKQYSKALANIPPGMENSTLRVQMERASADASREAYNNDMLAAVGDAQQYIAGLQGAASNQQNMTNAERNMQRNLVTDRLNYGTTTLNNSLRGGQYGQDYYGNEKAMRGRNIEEVGALQNMRNNTALSDYTNSLSLAGAENSLANDFINQTLDLSTAPSTYSAQGQAGISNSNSISALGTMAANQQTIASQASSGLGGWWSNYKSVNNF